MTIGVVAIALALAGVFSGEKGEEAETAGTATVPKAEAEEEPAPPAGDSRPEVTTVEVGGRPTAISTSSEGVWVADSFSPEARLVDAARDRVIRFRLEGTAADVVATDADAYFALPEQQAVERRQLDDPRGTGHTVGLDGFPSAVAAADETVYALSDRTVVAIDAEAGEVVDRFGLGGFGSGLAAGGGQLWVAVDNREVVRIDPASGDARGDPVPVPDAFTVRADGDFVWALSASGELTRITPDSLEATQAPELVRGALDVAAGLGSVWVTSSRRMVTRLDPETLEEVGRPLRVGDEPASVSVDGEAVWVANGGDGTLDRIDP